MGTYRAAITAKNDQNQPKILLIINEQYKIEMKESLAWKEYVPNIVRKSCPAAAEGPYVVLSKMDEICLYFKS